MIPDLAGAMDELAARLTQGGVATVIDPADLNLPGALIGPNQLSFDTLSGDQFALTADLFLITGDTNPNTALVALSNLLTKTGAVLMVSTATAVTVNLANQSPDPLPALQCTVLAEVTNDE